MDRQLVPGVVLVLSLAVAGCAVDLDALPDGTSSASVSPLLAEPAGTQAARSSWARVRTSARAAGALRDACAQPGPAPIRSVVLLVDPNLEAELEPGLTTFVADLRRDAYDVVKHTRTERTPETLRAYLKQLYGTTSTPLRGAILIGDFPRPYFRIDYPRDAAAGYAERGPWEVISMQFYQDLDGDYAPAGLGACGSSNCYTAHTGAVASEIWVGVLPTHVDHATTVRSLNAYFAKNHLFRSGQGRPQRGFIGPVMGARVSTPAAYRSQAAYVLEDATYSFAPIVGRGNKLAPVDNTIGDPAAYPDAAFGYEIEMMSDRYDFAQFSGDGTPVAFGAKAGPGAGSIWVDLTWADTHPIRPVFVWNGACSTANLDYPRNLGATFLYHPSSGVLAYKGATNLNGGMGQTTRGFDQHSIATALAEGASIGDAIASHMASPYVGYSLAQREYYTAQHILLGDGTLRLQEFMLPPDTPSAP